MFSWKANNYLLVVDRMLGYIFVEVLHKNAKCKTFTEKFKLLALTYGFPREVRYDKGPQFSQEFEEFLKEIHVNPTPSSANNLRSNGLVESAVRNAKILLCKLWKRSQATQTYSATSTKHQDLTDIHQVNSSTDVGSDHTFSHLMTQSMWTKGRLTEN